jgi:hypothetical protein
MRRLFRSVLALAALAVGLPGCSKSDETRSTAPPPSSGDRAEDKVGGMSSAVTVHVPGMT